MKEHPTFTNYIVSENGEVINKKRNRKLKSRTNDGGYLVVSLRKNKKHHVRLINRLVLQTYNPIENDNLYHAHHENTIKTDNRLENLKWELVADHLSKHHKDKVISEETRRKMSKSQKGRVLTEETKKKMSEAQKGHLVSDETKRKISEAKKGKGWWNDGVKNIRSKEHPGEGWIRGRFSRRQS